MPPKLLSDDKRNIVIRPLTFCRESDIAKYAKICQFPIIPCNLCGSQENLQRKVIKSMLLTWEKDHPGRIENIFNSIRNISSSQLADEKVFDFENLILNRQEPRTKYDHAGPQISHSNLIEIFHSI